jgi:lysophospholipase L1-like esterase
MHAKKLMVSSICCGFILLLIFLGVFFLNKVVNQFVNTMKAFQVSIEAQTKNQANIQANIQEQISVLFKSAEKRNEILMSIIVPQKDNGLLVESSYYENKKSFFDAYSKGSYDAVFIGDSLTDIPDWGEIFPKIKIANRGVNGDRTDGVLNRLSSIMSTKAPKAFVMIGVNDFSINRDVREVFDDYKKIVGQLQENGMQVYVQSTILAGRGRGGVNSRILSLNTFLEKFASNSQKVTYIDLNSTLAPAGVLLPEYTFDSIHLNAKGYSVWKEIITPFLIKNK